MIRHGLASVLFYIGRLGSRVTRLTTYLAVSTLRLAEMRDGIRRSWQDFYPHEAQIMGGLMPWERELVERFVPAGAEVLVIGCGTGRDLLALAERGCHVTGVDPADGALRTAQRVLHDRGVTVSLVEGFFEEAPLTNRVDVVIFSYYSYTYIPESHRRISALRKAGDLLNPGGHILLSYSFDERPRGLLISLGRLMAAMSRSDWRLETGDLIYGIEGLRPCYSYSHAFQPGEIQREAAAAGLRSVFGRDSGDSPVLVLARP